MDESGVARRNVDDAPPGTRNAPENDTLLDIHTAPAPQNPTRSTLSFHNHGGMSNTALSPNEPQSPSLPPAKTTTVSKDREASACPPTQHDGPRRPERPPCPLQHLQQTQCSLKYMSSSSSHDTAIVLPGRCRVLPPRPEQLEQHDEQPYYVHVDIDGREAIVVELVGDHPVLATHDQLDVVHNKETGQNRDGAIQKHHGNAHVHAGHGQDDENEGNQQHPDQRDEQEGAAAWGECVYVSAKLAPASSH